MNPKNQNILNVLNLLVLLLRANRQKHPKLKDHQVHTLLITKEHIQLAGITAAVFVNTIESLSQRGYLMAVSVFEKKYQDAVQDLGDENKFNEIIEAIKASGKDKLPVELKTDLADAFERMIPLNSNFELDREGLIKDNMTFTGLLSETKDIILDIKEDGVSTVILMPFRDIEILLEKMNEGKSFDEIQDSSIWYDSEKFQFHIVKDIIHTSYQDKPNIEHYVLNLIPEHLDDGVIWFDEIEYRTSRSIKDALLKFISKNDKLKNIFTIHSNRLEFDIEAFK